MTQRMGYASVALLISAVAALAGIIWDYNGLRGGSLPWGVAGFALAASVVVWEYRRRSLGRPRRLLIAGSVLVQVVLVSMVLFFLAVAIGNAAGSHALRHTDGGLATLATLIGSIEVMVLLPIGLITLAVAVACDRQLSRGFSALAAVAVLVYFAGPLLVGMLPDSSERAVTSVWLLVVACTWIAIARRLDGLPPAAPSAR